MSQERKSMLIYLMELDFALVETNLYLDTHPTDENALKLHNTLVEKYRNLECMYESKFGPITAKSKSRFPWQYVEEPWPWQIEF